MLRYFPSLIVLICALAPIQAADLPSPAHRMKLQIDKWIQADWKAHKIVPAPMADDSEFLRRVYLDLIGRSPRVAETRAFLADPSADKRRSVVRHLLELTAHAEHFADIHRADWLPQTLTDPRLMFAGYNFETWLQREYERNTPQDELVEKILTVDAPIGQRGRMTTERGERNDVVEFYVANEGKPEQLAATVSRVFLGVKLECAQCHDHPFARYSREQFWEFSAFFAEFTPLPPISPSFVGPLQPQYLVNRLTIPNTTREVVARHFDGQEPNWSPQLTPRQELANWIKSPSNPILAQNLVNRLWAHFFGIGLIDPVDEPGEGNPPSHPELLESLTQAFLAAKFDRRVLIEAIVTSEAYQRTSRQTDASQSDPRRFARMAVRTLSANQLYDSFLAATGQRDTTDRRVAFQDIRNSSGRAGFRQLFPKLVAKPTEGQTSILQALMMMNGPASTTQTSLDRSEVLAAVVDAPFLDTPKKIETLFLAALARVPTEAELEKYGSYIERGGPSGQPSQAVADLFWVLLNSPEFLLNH